MLAGSPITMMHGKNIIKKEEKKGDCIELEST
jgi:hypothetical protein